jgi:hypothetical protein
MQNWTWIHDFQANTKSVGEKLSRKLVGPKMVMVPETQFTPTIAQSFPSME